MFPKHPSTNLEKSKLSGYKSNGSFQTLDLSSSNKMEFSKTPSNSKNSFNLSFDNQNPQLFYTPKLTNLKLGIISDDMTISNTKIIDNLSNATVPQSENIVTVVELQFQLSSLKLENKRLKDNHQNQIQKLILQKSNQFDKQAEKVKLLNQQVEKEKLGNQLLTNTLKTLQDQNNELINKLNDELNTLQSTTKKYQQNCKLLQQSKQSSKAVRSQLIELTNKCNLMEAEILNLRAKFQKSESRMIELQNKQSSWKSMILTMSEEKTLLNNRISQMLEQQAKLQSAQALDKLQQGKTQTQKSGTEVNKQMQKEIEHLKSRINELLNQQQSGSMKMFYEQKLVMMEKQIQQLKSRYQSPQTVSLDDKSDQNYKRMLNDKEKQINDLKNIMTNQQNKINQLHKQIEAASSRKQTPSNISDVEINNMRLQIKNQKRVIDLSDQKLKYLIEENKKKDDFLKQYLSASTRDNHYVEEFFKKYSYNIPSDGFSNMVLKDTKMIQELEDKVRILTNKLYGGK